ncbi:metallophosphoesterase [Pedobacter heparinus]|uniref:metallophosphoesterase n=1 Tax=Pedobacter heparinus TaxID=984 RepID=UPI00292D9710|nr:metallophosphoesterase [Pedobacter heparinus]
MRKLLQKLLSPWVIKLANRYGTRPDSARVHDSLTALYESIRLQPGKRGQLIKLTDQYRIVVFSDQHRGDGTLKDDFVLAEPNYLAAMEYYNVHEYLYCNLGDSEELWENLVLEVINHNKATFEAEKLFLKRNAYIKLFGNHDLYWDNDPLAGFMLQRIFGQKIKVFEGIVFEIPASGRQLSLFLTHGHQGDLQSDGNWFSKWFVSTIWGPLQSFLKINPNTPAYDNQLKSAHNQFMYEWTAKQSNLALITGHTHQPVFNSLTHLERTYIRLDKARKERDQETIQKLEAALLAGNISGDTSPRLKASKNTYFNTGCCCFSDGDITGIELENGIIRLIEWKKNSTGVPQRIVLEEAAIESLLDN